MTKQSGKIILTIMLAVLILHLYKEAAEAIPVFARKYKTSCSTCHIAFPKLNPFGEVFRGNGYQIPEFDERYVKEKPVNLGAPAWKDAWPDGIWPGELPLIPPLSLAGNFLYHYSEDSEVRHDFIFPDEVELLSAGTLDRDISFFGNVALIEDGDFGGVERFFIRFGNLLNSGSAGHLASITIGQFEPAYVPASNRRRLTHTAYLINTFEAGKNNFHFGDQRDIYLKAGYKFGGIGLDGSGIKEGEWLHGDWKESSVYIGAFGYYGENRVVSSLKLDDRFYRYGLNFSISYADVNLFGAVLAGNHDNPDGDFKKRDVLSYFAEADISIYPWLTGILRYGMADTDYGRREDEAVAGLVALVRANIKLIIEGKIDTMGSDNDNGFIKLEFAI